MSILKTIGLAAVIAIAVFGQNYKEPGSSAKLSSTDSTFIRTNIQGGHKEVAMAQMALDKTSNPDVKKLAQRLVDDHTKVNKELEDLAAKKGVTISEADKTPPASATAKISRLNGDAFDREFANEMVTGHEQTIAKWETEAKVVKDPDLKSIVEGTLPTLREHLQMAKSVQQSTGSMMKK